MVIRNGFLDQEWILSYVGIAWAWVKELNVRELLFLIFELIQRLEISRIYSVWVNVIQTTKGNFQTFIFSDQKQ